MSETEKLAKNVADLSERVREGNSFWRSFLRGILWGLGTAIGASIIAAIIIAMLNKFLQSAHDHNLPVINHFQNVEPK